MQTLYWSAKPGTFVDIYTGEIKSEIPNYLGGSDEIRDWWSTLITYILGFLGPTNCLVEYNPQDTDVGPIALAVNSKLGGSTKSFDLVANSKLEKGTVAIGTMVLIKVLHWPLERL